MTGDSSTRGRGEF